MEHEDVSIKDETVNQEDLDSFLSMPSKSDEALASTSHADLERYPTPPPSLSSISVFEPIVVAVGVIGFDHTIGAILEYLYPLPPSIVPSSSSGGLALPDEWRWLPFLALPDGCHHESEDYCYFSLPALGFGRGGGPTTLYGVSMFRQVVSRGPSEETASSSTDRNRIQKCIVVLASAPMYGVIQARLWAISHAYFSQGLVEENGFSDFSVLEQFYHSFTATLSTSGMHEENLFLSFQPHQLVLRFGMHTLTLFKCLLLEKRVLFTGLPISYLCNTILTLVSLIPGLLAWPFCIGPSNPADRDAQLRLFSSFGLPLKCFVRQALMPYVCLQQMDDLAALSSFFASSSNPLFLRALPPGAVQVLVDVEQHSVQVLDPSLSPSLTLSPPDRAFMTNIINAVREYEKTNSGWVGSNDWVRHEFQRYLFSFLGAVSTIEGIFQSSSHPDADLNLQPLYDFDYDFTTSWFKTYNYLQWRQDVKPKLMKRHIKQEPSLSFHHPSQNQFGYYDQAASTLNKVKDWGWGLSGWF